METNHSSSIPSDFRPPTLSSGHVIGEPSSSSSPFHPTTLIFNPRHQTKKKRSKFIRIDATAAGLHSTKPTRKPDPSAPKITPPCTECGRKFWSSKALFGHMRCHPERQWRGINPPPNFRRTAAETISDERDYLYSSSLLTEEDHEVAACLLMLAHSAAAPPPEYSDSAGQHIVDGNCGRFECASCKKVFGSHQALGGHRASHKNVKGCYAITRNNNSTAAGGGDHHQEQEEGEEELGWYSEDNNNNGGHKCNICFRVFSSGQALGGHMRCHWDKEESRVFGGFDLNLSGTGGGATTPPPPPPPPPPPLPPVVDDDGDASSPYCSGMALDLRLGL